jgi:surfeit locus 1 family protein
MKRIALHALALVLVAAFVALGFWQLDRERQKRGQLAAAAAALAAPATDLAAALRSPTAVMQRVAGDVRFIDAAPTWLDNQRRGDRVGVRQYCFAEPLAGGPPILVDLGWLPLAGDRRLPAHRCPPGEHRLAGLLVPPPSAGFALGPGLVEQGDGWLATRIDIAQIARLRGRAGLSGRVLRLDPATPLGFERDLALLANTLPPEKHRGYALQWFGLAAALVVIVLVLNFRRKPQS